MDKNIHYCRMLLTRHYDQRPFYETMCDALITNGDVKNRQKRCKTFAMEDASNTVQILVACAMQGIRFSSINCLRWEGTKEIGSQMKVCAIYNIRFTRMNCLWLGNTKETVSQIKVCAIYDMWFTQMNCLRWDKRTETVQYNKYHKYCKVHIQRLQPQIQTLQAASFLKRDQLLTSHVWVWHNDFQLLCHMLFQYEVWHFWRHFHSAVPAASDNHTIDLS